MPIKFHRSEVFRDGASQCQTIQLDGERLRALSALDRIVCDKNYGREQPDSPFHEIDDWFNHDQYWSDAYNTRWNLAVSLYYLATHPHSQDFGGQLAESLSYRDDWQQWPEQKRSAVSNTVFVLWQWLLDQTASSPDQCPGEITWKASFAGRLFEFADKMAFLDADYFAELFQPQTSTNRFRHDYLFVAHYWRRILNPDDDWAKYLPKREDIVAHLRDGFFAFPEHEAGASAAEQLIAWDAALNALL